MTRHLTLLALLFLAFTGCEPNAASSEQAEETMEEAEETTMDDTSTEVQTVATVEGDYGGTMKIIDGNIKSHRKELSGTVGGVPVRINYGSPAVNDRVIYGDLVPFDKVWRTGANEATTITFEQDVVVGADAKKLKAGTYSLFTLPRSKEDWTVIFNTDSDQWGAYDYEESKDAVRAVATSSPIDTRAERMDFRLAGDGIMLMWDDLMIEFPVASASK